MKTMQITAFMLSMLTSAFASAGAANAQLNCQSTDGLKITGHVPGDFAEFDVTVEQNKKSTRLYSVSDQNIESSALIENASIDVKEDFKHKVWKMTSKKIAAHAEFIQIEAVPQTLRVQKIYGGYRANFGAKAVLFLSEISEVSVQKVVTCTLKYEI